MYKQKRNDLCRCGSNKKYKKCCLIIYQSPMYKQKLNLGRSGYDVVKKYVELPILPRGIEITIGSIGVLNWDSDERRPCDELTYGLFTQLKPIEFPKQTQDEFVSPVVITDVDQKRFRIEKLFWMSLIDIFDAIMTMQEMTGDKLFPQKIFIDNRNEWMSELMYMVRIRIQK